MSVERQPLNALNTKEASYKAMLSAYGTIKSDLSSLQNAAAALKLQSAFSVFKATPADTTVLGATADSTAVAGSYTVAINNRASAETRMSAGQDKTADILNGATTLDITVGAAATVSVSIAANSTLEGVRDAINSANTGVNATIVYNGTDYNLVYTAKDTGLANTISAISTDNTLQAVAGTGAGGGMNSITSTAANASLTVNGVPVSSATNAVTGAIQGVTLNLTKDAGTTTVTVARDTSSIESAVNKFISAYNQLNTDIRYSHSKGNKLQSDSAVVSIQNQLNGILNSATGFSASGGYDYLAEVGISRQTDGSLSLDAATFESKLSSNLSGVVQLFTDANKGIATSFYNEAFKMTGVNGLVTSRTAGLNTSIRYIEDKIDAFNIRLEIIQKRYTKQFTALNTMISNMQQTSSFLSQRLGV
jgi:flagellar hook-associated protein 2